MTLTNPMHEPVPMVALRLFRLSREISQSKLSKRVHIPASELSYMEQGRLIPSADQAARLEAYFGVSAGTLFKQFDLLELLRRL